MTIVTQDGIDAGGRYRHVPLDLGPANNLVIVTFSEERPGQGKVTWLTPRGNSSTTYDIEIAKRVVTEYEAWQASLQE